MPVIEDVFSQVDDDLAHGDHASARTRLREALVTRPYRLDLRLRLASIYRMLGDLPQAGRWGYLSPDTPDEEVQAFRTACGDDPFHMLEALVWADEDELTEPEAESDSTDVTAFAWERIAVLRRAVATAIKADPARYQGRVPVGQAHLSAAAVPYPFTPPTGIAVQGRGGKKPKTEKRPARKREHFGLVLVFAGVLGVLAELSGIVIGAIWIVGQIIEKAYGS